MSARLANARGSNGVSCRARARACWMTHFDDDNDGDDENDNDAEDDDDDDVTSFIIPEDESEFTRKEAFDLTIRTAIGAQREGENCGEHVARAQRDED